MDPTVNRVLIADDHPVVLQGLETLFASRREFVVVASASTGRGAVECYRQSRPDVAVIDLRLPDISGLVTLRLIREIDPEARVLILSAFDEDENVYRAVRDGARGYALKSSLFAEIIAAVHAILRGERYLPATVSEQLAQHVGRVSLASREIQILELASQGNKNKEIANRLSITEGTVKGYFNNIFLKLGARDRTDAVTTALRRGLIRIDSE